MTTKARPGITAAPPAILIVEDEAIVAMNIEHRLQKLGYEIAGIAVTAEEAIACALDTRPDLILMDIKLDGGLDGVYAAEQIRSLMDLPVPVIYLTAFANAETLQRAKITEPFGYLLKPFEERELHATIEMALYKNRMEKKMRQKNRGLALLNQASQAFSATLDLDQVLTTVLEETRRLLDVAACSVWLVESLDESDQDQIQENQERTDDPPALICRHATGPQSELVLGWRLAPGMGLAGWAAHHSESLIVPDAQADPRHNHTINQHTGLSLRSIISVPLRGPRPSSDYSRVIGVLQAVDTQVGRFGPEDLALLEPLTASAAIAIENARLYEQAQREIAERIQAEKAREQLLDQIQGQARRMQQIMDTVPEGVLLLNVEGQVISANPAAREHLDQLARPGPGIEGIEKGEPIVHLGDRALSELIKPPPKGLWHEIATDQASFQIIAHPLEMGVEAQEWVMVIRDVTQQREIESRAQQQERLAAVGQLAAGIAHDFNNIMAVIALYARMSLRAPDLSPKLRERLETIDQQAWRASELIQQILDFSRRAVFERSPMDLLIFLKEQTKILERTLPENIEILLTYERDEYIVKADPTRMQQAIMNLATNARDAMPDGGEWHIQVKRVEIDDPAESPLPELGAGAWVCVKTTDTGVGIPPDVLPHIFDPFYTTKDPDKGTGLGLAQVFGIVKAHEGHIHVTSTIGEGTSFTIYLPALSIPQAGLRIPQTSDLIHGQGETILVAEDDDATRQALVEGLNLLNYRVLEAANGQEALCLFEQRADQIDLILSDVVMPEMGGQELLKALRQRKSDAPVLLLTGHPMAEELDDLREQGLSGWILKPPSIEQLSQVLAQTLGEVVVKSS